MSPQCADLACRIYVLLTIHFFLFSSKLIRHKVELKKTEAKMAAAEKLRREKWEAEKTKQLKVSQQIS